MGTGAEASRWRSVCGRAERSQRVDDEMLAGRASTEVEGAAVDLAGEGRKATGLSARRDVDGAGAARATEGLALTNAVERRTGDERASWMTEFEGQRSSTRRGEKREKEARTSSSALISSQSSSSSSVSTEDDSDGTVETTLSRDSWRVRLATRRWCEEARCGWAGAAAASSQPSDASASERSNGSTAAAVSGRRETILRVLRSVWGRATSGAWRVEQREQEPAGGEAGGVSAGRSWQKGALESGRKADSRGSSPRRRRRAPRGRIGSQSRR